MLSKLPNHQCPKVFDEVEFTATYVELYDGAPDGTIQNGEDVSGKPFLYTSAHNSMFVANICKQYLRKDSQDVYDYVKSLYLKAEYDLYAIDDEEKIFNITISAMGDKYGDKVETKVAKYFTDNNIPRPDDSIRMRRLSEVLEYASGKRNEGEEFYLNIIELLKNENGIDLTSLVPSMGITTSVKSVDFVAPKKDDLNDIILKHNNLTTAQINKQREDSYYRTDIFNTNFSALTYTLPSTENVMDYIFINGTTARQYCENIFNQNNIKYNASLAKELVVAEIMTGKSRIATRKFDDNGMLGEPTPLNTGKVEDNKKFDMRTNGWQKFWSFFGFYKHLTNKELYQEKLWADTAKVTEENEKIKAASKAHLDKNIVTKDFAQSIKSAKEKLVEKNPALNGFETVIQNSSTPFAKEFNTPEAAIALVRLAMFTEQSKNEQPIDLTAAPSQETIDKVTVALQNNDTEFFKEIANIGFNAAITQKTPKADFSNPKVLLDNADFFQNYTGLGEAFTKLCQCYNLTDGLLPYQVGTLNKGVSTSILMSQHVDSIAKYYKDPAAATKDDIVKAAAAKVYIQNYGYAKISDSVFYMQNADEKALNSQLNTVAETMSESQRKDLTDFLDCKKPSPSSLKIDTTTSPCVISKQPKNIPNMEDSLTALAVTKAQIAFNPPTRQPIQVLEQKTNVQHSIDPKTTTEPTAHINKTLE